MTTPLDLITDALIQIGAVAIGESADSDKANFALRVANRMLDNWSNQHLMIYYQTEIIHEITANQFVYTLGSGGTLFTTMTGSISGNLLTVSATTGAICVGQILSGSGITTGTQITGLESGLGGNGAAALGSYQVYPSQTVGSVTITAYIPRPLKINSAFVRVATLDYPVKILSFEDYEKIGLKNLNGPWPYGLYYQPTEPRGTLTYWPVPSSGEMHIFADSIFSQFRTLTQVLAIPQGYEMAIMWNIAALMVPAYGKSDPTQLQMVAAAAASSMAWLKRTNMLPQQEMQYPSALLTGRQKDAGWIYSGGFR